MCSMLYVASPHSDDAALSLACTLKTFSERGVNISIINCFSFTNWAPQLRMETSADIISMRRKTEDSAFAQLLGKNVECIHLHLTDTPLRRDWVEPNDKGRFAIPDRAVLEECRNGLRVALQPYISDPTAAWAFPLALRHRDHSLVRRVLLESALTHPKLVYEDVPYVFLITHLAQPSGMRYKS
jgi:LmbE family N-acetylglucosaminyl deacetylase